MSFYGLADFEECHQKVLWQPHTLEPSSARPFLGPIGAVGEHPYAGALAAPQQSPLPC